MINCNEIIKQSVSMKDICYHYGIPVNRAGFAKCPFHANGDERTPSMKIYNGERGYACFACHSSGDVIDFVMRYLNLPFKDAVRRINVDFALNLPLGGKLTDEEKTVLNERKRRLEAKKKFEAWKASAITQMSKCYLLAHQAKKSNGRKWSNAEIMAIKFQELLEYYLDILNGSDVEGQKQVYQQRKDVSQLCEKILTLQT